jgi:glycosyltransferase involved in cell wall biosynthesis
MPDPEISVVIRAFNEEKYLPDLLEALNHQSIDGFETIVVDSGSLDRTREIAAEKADQLLRIQSHDFTFGHSLNVGICNASGTAHTIPAGDQWLKKLIEPLHDSRTAMVYGRQLGGEASKFSEIQDMRRTFGSNREVLQPPNALSVRIVKFCSPPIFLQIMRIPPSAKIYGNSILLMKACRGWKILNGPKKLAPGSPKILPRSHCSPQNRHQKHQARLVYTADRSNLYPPGFGNRLFFF